MPGRCHFMLAFQCVGTSIRVSGGWLGGMPAPGQLIFRIRLQGQIFRLRCLARMLCAGLAMRYAQFRIFGPMLFFKQQSGQPRSVCMTTYVELDFILSSFLVTQSSSSCFGQR